ALPICRAEGRAALVPYLTAGYPTPADTLPILDALVAAGADVIELGVPFSDPLADGPTIQRASFRALGEGTTVARVLEMVGTFRWRHETPVVLFSYLNPVLRYGLEAFVRDAVAAGAAGLLVTDRPGGSDPETERLLAEAPLDLIRLIAPTTPPARMDAALAGGSGFVYYVSRTGVTGARADLRSEIGD